MRSRVMIILAGTVVIIIKYFSLRKRTSQGEKWHFYFQKLGYKILSVTYKP